MKFTMFFGWEDRPAMMCQAGSLLVGSERRRRQPEWREPERATFPWYSEEPGRPVGNACTVFSSAELHSLQVANLTPPLNPTLAPCSPLVSRL